MNDEVAPERIADGRDTSTATPLRSFATELTARSRTLQETAEDLLGALVAIDTGADHPEGQAEALEVYGQALDDIGISCTMEHDAESRPVLRAAQISGSPRRFLLLGHMDTVFARGTATARPLNRVQDRLHGPGVADMKGGLTTIWLALAALRDLGLDTTVDWELLVNADEESGSSGSRGLLEAAARSADLALVYEPGRPSGAFVTRRRGHRRYRVHVDGKAAHTGVEPEAGVNALVELSHQIVRIAELDTAHPGANVTVTLASGGAAINVVPEAAEARVDVRIPDAAVLATLHDAMTAISQDVCVPGAHVTLEAFAERPPMEELPGVQHFVDELRQLAHGLNLQCDLTATGGGSDAGIVTSVGTPAIDGMGAVGGRIHTADEYLEISTMPERATVTAAWLAGAHVRLTAR